MYIYAHMVTHTHTHASIVWALQYLFICTVFFFWAWQYFSMCIEALKANSDKFKVFCLVHKMDLVPVDVRASVFAKQVPSFSHPSPLALKVNPHALN